MTRTRLSMPAFLLLISLCVTLIFAGETVTGKYEQDESQNLLVLFPPVGEQTLSISQRTVIRRNPINNTLTNDHLLPIIRGFHVNSTIYYRFAQTKICTIVYNPSNDSKEFTFNHPVPREAYVSGFTIGGNGNTEKATFGIYRPIAYKAYSKKSFSKEIGKPIIVSINARHSVLFSLPLEVPAHKELTLCLKYEEILKRTAGNYQYPVHVSTNTVAGIDLNVRIHIKDSEPLRNINVTGFVSENKMYSSDSGATLALKDDDGCRSEVSYIDISCISTSEVVISFKPTEEDQKNFITSYAQSKKIEHKENLMGLGGSDYMSSSLPTVGLNGKFEILYNVEPSEDDIGSGILYNDKHFVHFLEPLLAFERVNIHLIIVIDYRFDHKHQFDDVMTALENVLRSVDNDGDYFNSVMMVVGALLSGFGVENRSINHRWTSFSRSDLESDDAKTDADESMKRNADRLMKKLNAVVDIPAGPISRLSITGLAGFLTGFLRNGDPEAYTEMGLRAAVRCALSCYKEDNQTQGVQPLPVILYLPRTDNHGVGEHDFSKIASMVTNENFQGPRAQLFALKLDQNSGQNVEEGLWNFTAANGGWMDKLYESQHNVKEQVYAFFNAFKNPLTLNISVTYRNGDKKAPVLTQSTFPTLYSGREAIIGGEFPEGIQENEFQATISGILKAYHGTYFNDTFHVTKYRRIDDTIGESEESVIDRIWAHARIKDLLVKSATAFLRNRSSPGAAKDDSSWQDYDTEGRELSLRYNLLTPFTTLIVKPHETHVMKLAPIVPYDIGEQFLHTVFREESIETYKTTWKWLNRLNNVTWIDDIVWSPSLSYVPVRGALNKTYFTPIFDATNWYDPQNCSTLTTPPIEGKCEHFVNCILPEVESDMEMFRKYQCKIPGGNYLAICCPKRDQASNDYPISKKIQKGLHIYNNLLKKYFLERNIPSIED